MSDFGFVCDGAFMGTILTMLAGFVIREIVLQTKLSRLENDIKWLKQYIIKDIQGRNNE
jgi:hypothetical protein